MSEASPAVAAATPPGAVGATTSNQRYVVDLQRPVSYLGMGQSLSDKSATSQTLNGICLSTAERIYISATTPNTSDIQITSQSNVIIDALGAAGTINLYGKKTAIVDSGGGAYLLGAGGVMIAAGLTDSHGPGGGYTVSTTTEAMIGARVYCS